MSSQKKDEYIKNVTERLVASAKINERMSKLIRDFEQENERLRLELRNVTRACNASKSEPALSGIDNVCKKIYERLKMECEILNNEKRQQSEELKDLRIYIERVEQRAAFLEYESKRLAAVLHAQEIQMGKYTKLYCLLIFPFIYVRTKICFTVFACKDASFRQYYYYYDDDV